MKVVWYFLVVILGALGLLGALRTLEHLFFGGFSAYELGRAAGSALFAVLFLYLAARSLSKARAA